ncbi:hypothetical protein [Streptomyces capparidis]
MTRAIRTVSALAVAAALLGGAACSGEGGPPRGDGRGERTGAASPSAAASASARPALPRASRFPVPEGFDNTRGWTEAVTEPDSRSHGSWAVAPAAGLLVQAVNADGEVHARELATGEEAWTFTAPTKLRSATTDVHITTEPGGGELAVIVRDGITAEDDGVTRSRSVVTVDTVRAGSSGAAAAVRHFEYEDGEVGPFTGALLVTDRAKGRLVALEPATGKEYPVRPAGEVKLPACRKADMPPSAACAADATVEFTTPAGPVAAFTQDSYCDHRWRESDRIPCAEGFTVGVAWNSAKVAPKGAADATPLAVVGDHVVVAWSQFRDAATEEEAERDVVAVHDLGSGELLAQVECDITNPRTGTGSVAPLAAQAVTQLSGDGDWLISGQVGFDLAAGRGRCFADTAGEKGVTLTAVTDTGRAFGVTYDASGWADVAYGAFPHDFASEEAPVRARTVEADLASGRRTALPERTAVPVFVSPSTGLFLRAGTLGAYPAKR